MALNRPAAKTFVLSRPVQGERELDANGDRRTSKGGQPIRQVGQDENRTWQDKEVCERCAQERPYVCMLGHSRLTTGPVGPLYARGIAKSNHRATP